MSRNNIADAENFFETASKEELIDYLVKTIQKEVSKGDDADCDLVRECSDWLDELTRDEIVFTPDELERNLEKIKAKVMSDKPIKKRKKMSVKTFMRVALIAAVIFTISILSLSAMAVNKGYSSAWDYISVSVGKMFGLNHGEEINDGCITVIKNAESFRYNNVDDFLKAEGLSIFYPHSMPNGIEIKQIRYVYESEANFIIFFDLSNNAYTFYMSNYYSIETTTLNTFDNIIIDEQNYFITQKGENFYYAILQNEGLEYIIQAPNYDDLLSILNNMKG